MKAALSSLHPTRKWKCSSKTTANPAPCRSLVCTIFQRVCAIAGATPLTRGVCGWAALFRRSGEAGSEQAGRLRYAWHRAPSRGEQLSNGRVTWSRAWREWEQPWRLNHSCGMKRGRHTNVLARKIRRGMRGWRDCGWDEQRNERLHRTFGKRPSDGMKVNASLLPFQARAIAKEGGTTEEWQGVGLGFKFISLSQTE